jgi:hypothetical protein
MDCNNTIYYQFITKIHVFWWSSEYKTLLDHQWILLLKNTEKFSKMKLTFSEAMFSFDKDDS